MRARRILIPAVLLGIVLCCLYCSKETGGEGTGDRAEAPPFPEPDSADVAALLAHVRSHFDDIHDVTMRYHHKDPEINGRVVFFMLWEGGILKDAEVVGNETGDAGLPDAIIENIREWKIEGLKGPAHITIPFNVQLVGRDDPDFPNTAILTGEVADADGNPLHGALILIRPEVAGRVYRTETNREGIFVTTLIPAGIWDLECSLPGYDTAARAGVDLAAGEHRRERFVLEKK